MTALPPWVEEDAHFADARHRVWLRRRLAMFGTPAVFILHNPSIADRDKNDPTLNRGVGFANAWGCSEVVFVNAATGVATDAGDLADMDDPIGTRCSPSADEALQVAAEFCRRRGGIMVAAWGAPKGNNATRRLMAARFQAILALGLDLHVLRLTPSGHPEHPLYLPASLTPVPWAYR